MADVMPVRSFPRRPPPEEPTRGLIRPIYAGVFDLDPNGGFERARQVVDEWLRTHGTLRAHANALPAGDFELDRHLEKDRLLAQIVTSRDGNVVVARLQHHEPLGKSWDPIRNWRTEITIERDEEAAWIATRQWFAGIASDSRRCSPPRFIKKLLDEKALSDLDILEPGVRVLEFEAEAAPLAELLLDPDRDFPVVLMADGCPLDPVRVADESAGLAHVVRLVRPVRLALMRILGPEYDLQHGAISTFYASAGGARPLAPAAKFETIIAWRYNGAFGPGAFARWLHDEIARAVLLRLLNDPAHRTIEGVKVTLVDERRAQLSTQAPSTETILEELAAANELITLYEEERRKTEEDLKELTVRAEGYLNESKAVAQALRAEEQRNWRLQTEKASLVYMLAAKNGDAEIVMDAPAIERLIEQQPEPPSVVEAVDRAKDLFELYGAPVRVSETALESAFDSPFKRPKDVLAALLRLGFLWNEMKNSGRPTEEVVHETVRFPCSMHESQTTKNKYGAERIATFDGGHAQLEKHLKIGSGGPDASVRIYFGDRDGELLIGHVGRHLTVAKTQ